MQALIEAETQLAELKASFYEVRQALHQDVLVNLLLIFGSQAAIWHAAQPIASLKGAFLHTSTLPPYSCAAPLTLPSFAP